jgi:hypothetical protein
MDALAASNAEAPAVSNDLAAIKAIPDRFFNRELSWLTFNQRVLEGAAAGISVAGAAAFPVDFGQQSGRIPDGARRGSRRTGAPPYCRSVD